jgi:hypothetical protein
VGLLERVSGAFCAHCAIVEVLLPRLYPIADGATRVFLPSRLLVLLRSPPEALSKGRQAPDFNGIGLAGRRFAKRARCRYAFEASERKFFAVSTSPMTVARHASRTTDSKSLGNFSEIVDNCIEAAQVAEEAIFTWI